MQYALEVTMHDHRSDVADDGKTVFLFGPFRKFAAAQEFEDSVQKRLFDEESGVIINALSFEDRFNVNFTTAVVTLNEAEVKTVEQSLAAMGVTV